MDENLAILMVVAGTTVAAVALPLFAASKDRGEARRETGASDRGAEILAMENGNLRGQIARLEERLGRLERRDARTLRGAHSSNLD